MTRRQSLTAGKSTGIGSAGIAEAARDRLRAWWWMRLLLGVVGVQALLMIVLIVALLIIVGRDVSKRESIVAVTDDGQLHQLLASRGDDWSFPNTAVTAFVERALRECFSFDPRNYTAQLNACIDTYFNREGAALFVEVMQSSGILAEARDNFRISSLSFDGAAVIATREMPSETLERWEVRAPIVHTMTGAAGGRTARRLAVVHVEHDRSGGIASGLKVRRLGLEIVR